MIWFLLGLLPTFIFSQLPGLHPLSGQIHVKDKLILMHSMNESLLWAFIAATTYFLAKQYKKQALVILITLYWVNILMLFLSLFHRSAPGILMNGSMSGCLMVALLPLFPGFATIGLVGCLVTALMASLPFGMFVVFLILKYMRPWVLILILAMGAVIYAFQPELFYSNGRMELWEVTSKIALTMNKTYPLTRWFGSGLGSYFVIAPNFNEWRGIVFTYAHSDYLQVLFEGGVWSFTFFAAAIFSLWRKYQGSVLLVLILYLIWGVANFPAHDGFAVICFAIIFGVANERKTTVVPPNRR